MKRLLLIALLIAAGPVQAFEWPWQHQQRENYSYCKGFIFAGLGSGPVKDLSRIQLWLSWNKVLEIQFEKGQLVQEQYDAGKTRFDSLLASNDLDSLLQVADRDCDFAES